MYKPFYREPDDKGWNIVYAPIHITREKIESMKQMSDSLRRGYEICLDTGAFIFDMR